MIAASSSGKRIARRVIADPAHERTGAFPARGRDPAGARIEEGG